MSGPYGPNDAPGQGGGNDPTLQWGGQQPAPGAGPTQQWGGQQPAQPTTQWGDPSQQQQPAQPWGQSQPQQPWGQSQPQQPVQQSWGQSQPQWQQPQGGQQWGQSQPQWPQQGQPGQQDWNQAGQQWPQAQQPAPGKKKTGLIIGIVAAVVVVLAAAGGGLAWLLSKDQLDNKAVQSGVQKVLKDSYGIDDVQDVSCPSGQKVEVDKTFDCTLKVGGESKKVTIKITKDDGTYEVGRPS
ncbi:DUF4333 domain-containing protein [Nocardia aurantiaca]|uniref:DUF4333 domain-containing protein n=1 Tax=Nocardia aurantiaca TaxID=2675850 RepID=A0A6I3L0R5_9NOCA|nr:DUF4333 domain-containing protein [Nocardia aurantiaca]MTE14380.1 DUF4333 domain-containing protein [Nocardia aurantiaca]